MSFSGTAPPESGAHTILLRPASPADALDMARLVDMAGEGLSSYFWQAIALPGEDAWAVGARRAASEDCNFSWRNATIAEIGGETAALLITYRIGDVPLPIDDLPAIIQPLQELENLALRSLYVNVVAVYPRFRRRGVARKLMQHALDLGGDRELSLIVADGNTAAIALYETAGFVERTRRPVIEAGGWSCESREWVLMIRPSVRPEADSACGRTADIW
ncbi:MAG: GNAT family N-acetyltransferase [Rhodobacteraceae bacterium]|nr:GNAT family N-acetyltransferase [Paracoccaceae bacterium]